MNRRQIGLKLVLNELGVASTMESFGERLFLQKEVYLAQQADILLGYHYWFDRPELTGSAESRITAPLITQWEGASRGQGSQIRCSVDRG